MIDYKDLQAKSDQMNAVDFVRPMIFRVVKVDYKPRTDQPIAIHLEGCDGRPYKPSKGMLRALSQVWGLDEQQWVGRLIELYCDPEVLWAGKRTGGIRISAVSGIDEPFEFTLAVNRSQRKVETLNPLSEDTEVKSEFILTHHEDKLSKAQSNAEIDAIVKAVKVEYGAEAQKQLKDAVVTARKRLKGSVEASEEVAPE